MLGHARAAGARALTGDALALPLLDDACDAAVALGLASYVPDLTALMRELGRVVRPGGVVVVSVASAAAPDWFARRALRAPARALGFRGVLTSGIELAVHAPAAWRAAARAAGLELLEERGHDFTLFPFSRLLPGPAVVVGKALEARLAGPLAARAAEVVLRLKVPGPAARRRPRPRRLVRIIARLNIGGPAIHSTLLTAGLAPHYETTLATGAVGPGEEEATHLLERHGVEPVRIRGLGRAISPLDDLRALAELLALLRRVRPHVVHTHTAKAGAVGRVAARLAGVPRVYHTFHGHVLSGYFGPAGSKLAALAERLLARLTDRVVAVSDEVGRDLAERFRVVSPEKLEVIPLGLPLEPFAAAGRHRGELRAELGLAPEARIVSLVGRLVPVKEPQVALDVFERVRAAVPEARLVVCGAGPELAAMRARGVAGVHFLGWRSDTPRVLADVDVALLTSRNEGTPVALIEAGAAGVPAVATRVGGVPAVVEEGVTGLLCPRGDAEALAGAVVGLLQYPERRAALGVAARERMLGRFGAERLIGDLLRLYSELE